MVLLKRHFAAVIEVAVGFDHELPLSPEEVEEVGTDANVDLGGRQPVTTTEPQEVRLQVAAGSNPGVLVADWQAKHVRLADRLAQLTS